MKQNVTRWFAVMAFLWLAASQSFAISPADSIRRLLPRLHGKQKLEALDFLYDDASNHNNRNYEMKCLIDLRDEAHRQNQIDCEADARANILLYYYNYNEIEKLKAALPGELQFFAKHQCWGAYYNCWRALIEYYIYSQQLYTAYREVKKMYADAQARNIKPGKGTALYELALCYYLLNNNSEAIRNYKQAIPLLSGSSDFTSILLATYANYCDALDVQTDYSLLYKTCRTWKELLLKNGISNSGFYYAYYLCALSTAQMETHDMKNAKKTLDEINNKTLDMTAFVRKYYLMDLSRFYELNKDYGKALAINEERLQENLQEGCKEGLANSRAHKADILMKMGQYAEAALVYNAYVPLQDSLWSRQALSQLNDFNALSQADELIYQQQLTTYQLRATLIGVAVLLGWVGFYFFYARRLRRKNRILYDAIRRSHKLDEPTASPLSVVVSESLRLYQELCLYMQDEQPYKDAQLSREDLAQRLGTNYTYVVRAVKENAEGITVSEFVNRYRLRHAARLLTDNLDLGINETGYRSGFNSRTTYSRVFRNFFGMSPSEYREAAKERLKNGKNS